MNQPILFNSVQKCHCERCGAPCKIDPLPGSKAKMLKRGKTPKGLCVNCAAHDVLRNLYPANLLLARSGPKVLASPQIQQQFEEILKSAGTDAVIGEIDWPTVIDNWDLPFANKVKSSPMNPADQTELDQVGREGVPLHRPGYPLSAEEQIEEQGTIARKALKKIFPNGKIVIS